MEKFNWEGFKYPSGCILGELDRSAQIKAANHEQRSPFIRCGEGQRLNCPYGVQWECYKKAAAYKRSQK